MSEFKSALLLGLKIGLLAVAVAAAVHGAAWLTSRQPVQWAGPDVAEKAAERAGKTSVPLYRFYDASFRALIGLTL